jgi:hypothetical protein
MACTSPPFVFGQPVSPYYDVNGNEAYQSACPLRHVVLVAVAVCSRRRDFPSSTRSLVVNRHLVKKAKKYKKTHLSRHPHLELLPSTPSLPSPSLSAIVDVSCSDVAVDQPIGVERGGVVSRFALADRLKLGAAASYT